MNSLATEPATPKSVRPGARVETIHSLRGLAALAVALFHFSNGNTNFYVPSVWKAIGSKGWLGVEVFFVISGFILPYSLWRAGYRLSLSNFGRFVWKRIIRLDPPYFVTIALVLLLAYLSARSPGFHGAPFHLDPVQLALHVGYLNAFSGLPWLNPVFWTLAIECQFYLLIALFFPLFVSAKRAARMAGFGVLLTASLVYSPGNAVTHYLPLFACGMVAFQWFAGISAKWESVLILLPAAILLGMRMGSPVMLVGLAAAIAIVWMPPWKNAFLNFFGNISYSLYLLHVPVGGRVINLAQRLPPSALMAVVGIVAALGVSIGVSYVLYRVIERPAQRYAGSIKFPKNPSRSGLPSAACSTISQPLTIRAGRGFSCDGETRGINV